MSRFDAVAGVFDSWIGRACPGAAVEVRDRGEVLFRRFGGFTSVDERAFHSLPGLGEADPGPLSQVPVTSDTLFDVASLTKPLSTALLTAMACDDGVLVLDAPLREFPAMHPAPCRESITVRDLLSHRAAFPAWQPFAQRLIPENGIGTAGSVKARADCLSIAMGTPIHGTPGVDILYSDIGYIVLGMLLEHVYGMLLKDLFAERVAGPMDLARSGFRKITPVTGVVRPNGDEIAATAWCPIRQRLMQGEVHDDNAWYLGGAAGHAGLFSTVSETADLVDAWIDAAAGRSSLLGRDTATAFVFDDFGTADVRRTPAFDRPSPSGSNAGDHCPAGTVGHLGFTGTSFWFDRDSGLSIVLLTNRVNPEMYGNREEIRAMRRAVYDAVWDACH